MSKWIRGIYNSAANFNLSNALRAASGRFMGGNSEHMHKEPNKPNEHKQPNKSCKPTESAECGNASTCLGCAPFHCAKLDSNSSYYEPRISTTTVEYISRDKDGNDVPISLTITAREQDGSIDYTYSAKRKGIGSWVRTCDESGNTKQATSTTRNSVEHSTGIPTGVTV